MLIPTGRRARPAPAASQRPVLTSPPPAIRRRGPLNEASTRVQTIQPSGPPLAWRPRTEREPLGLPPSFAPRRPRADDARRGGDRPSSTDLELHAQHHICQSSNRAFTHCVRPRVAPPTPVTLASWPLYSTVGSLVAGAVLPSWRLQPSSTPGCGAFASSAPSPPPALGSALRHTIGDRTRRACRCLAYMPPIEPGRVKPGRSPGATAIQIASTASVAATPYTAGYPRAAAARRRSALRPRPSR